MDWAYEVRLLIAALTDPARRCWNDDVGNSLKSYGLYSTVIITTCIINLHYGAWNGAARFSQIVDAGKDIVACLTPNGRLFMSAWGGNCNDRFSHGTDATGESALASFTDGLQDLRSMCNT